MDLHKFLFASSSSGPNASLPLQTELDFADSSIINRRPDNVVLVECSGKPSRPDNVVLVECSGKPS